MVKVNFLTKTTLSLCNVLDFLITLFLKIRILT